MMRLTALPAAFGCNIQESFSTASGCYKRAMGRHTSCKEYQRCLIIRCCLTRCVNMNGRSTVGSCWTSGRPWTDRNNSGRTALQVLACDKEHIYLEGELTSPSKEQVQNGRIGINLSLSAVPCPHCQRTLCCHTLVLTTTQVMEQLMRWCPRAHAFRVQCKGSSMLSGSTSQSIGIKAVMTLQQLLRIDVHTAKYGCEMFGA